VNLAISRRARVTVSRIPAGFEFFSRDLQSAETFADAREARRSGTAAIAAEAAIALGVVSGVRFETESSVPFGSGLGGSSALLVAAVSALARLAGESLAPERAVLLCRDAETRVLGRPAGTQDYEPALRGGFNVIAYEAGGSTVRTLPARGDEFGRSLVLFDSGQPHSSGLNNWEIYKARIDGDADVRRALDGIRDAAEAMALALEARDLESMGRALGAEWAHRKRLSPRVTTPVFEEAELRAAAAGAWGVKACGAGGGGVMVVLGPPSARERIAGALRGVAGGSVFPAEPENDGVRWEV
jgi:D-glycero-alpha-D-manno-heptose-7-phosphate kinase